LNAKVAKNSNSKKKKKKKKKINTEGHGEPRRKANPDSSPWCSVAFRVSTLRVLGVSILLCVLRALCVLFFRG
jgi:hypothetical protein